MRIKLPNYNKEYRVVSIALDTETLEDLCAQNVGALYVQEKETILFPEELSVCTDCGINQKLLQSHNYDVFEIWNDGVAIGCYDNSQIDNYFFVTGKCNSNCIMCPSPEISRINGKDTPVKNLIEIAKHIPEDAPHLTITGGEPFMIGTEIFDFFRFLKHKFQYTEFLLLTNGRIFSVKKYMELLIETLPYNTIIAIPLHGATALTHDTITQSIGSYEQTLFGIKNLLAAGMHVELRIVVSRLNVDEFFQMAEMIVKDLDKIEYVSIIAMEMTGSAGKNKQLIWIPYREVFNKIKTGIKYLIYHGINVKLYNFPLCTVDEGLWTLCEKSISPNKVRYANQCNGCSMKDLCGGVFAGTIRLEEDELKAVL